MPRRSSEEIIVLVMCAICVSGLLPFSIYRLIHGDLQVALVDLVGLVGTSIAFFYVYRTRTIGLAGPLLASLALGGMVLNVSMLGPRDIHFLYPVVLLTYFLMQPRQALALTFLALLVLSLVLAPMMTVGDYSKFTLSILGCILFAYVFASQRNRQRDLLIQQSTIDPLTNAGNRRALRTRLDQLIASQHRTGARMSLIILDIDNFKDINDQDGHLTGDEVLKSISSTIAGRIRATDSVYRYGGDEFIVIAPSADAATAASLAEEIRALIFEKVRVSKLPVTVSLGVAEYRPSETADVWLGRADAAMYSAKKSGRNAVALDPHSAEVSVPGAATAGGA